MKEQVTDSNKRVLQTSSVADYLSHLPTSLSLHHFLKYSADAAIKKEAVVSFLWMDFREKKNKSEEIKLRDSSKKSYFLKISRKKRFFFSKIFSSSLSLKKRVNRFPR